MAAANIERLLTALEHSPDDAAALIFEALHTRGWDKVSEALTKAPRFVRWLLPAFRDARIRKDIPFLSRIIARHDIREAITDILAVWRRDDDAAVQSAGFALLEFGDEESLATLAADAPNRCGPALHCCLRAAFALSPPTEAYERLARHMGQDDFARTLFVFVSNNHELARRDPRWQEAAAKALVGRAPEVARESRRALVKLGGEEAAARIQRQRSAPASDAVARVSEADAAQARNRVTRALKRLADSGFALCRAADPSALDELESGEPTLYEGYGFIHLSPGF